MAMISRSIPRVLLGIFERVVHVLLPIAVGVITEAFESKALADLLLEKVRC